MRFIQIAGASLALYAGAAAAPPSATAVGRVIVLGFDGMDHDLAGRLMDEGKMPNLAAMRAEGAFSSLETSVPPQSPVAWSNFITGTDSGGHGIFDFVHRDPDTMVPKLSTSEAHPPDGCFRVGKYQFPTPFSGGGVQLLRHGQAFWEVLEQNGVDATIIRMPANYPPSGGATRELSGMGTPDLLGTPGTFQFYTSDYGPFEGESISGGKVYAVTVEHGRIEASLYGPDNPFLFKQKRRSRRSRGKQKEASAFECLPSKEKLELPFTVYIDELEEVVKLVVGDEERVLSVGEWSDWVPIEFPMIPTQDLSGIARFHLKSIRPVFELYVSPINIDPVNPAQMISTPADYAADLADSLGRFYTQEMPEDTKALTEKAFDESEFLDQARRAGEEVIRMYHHVLDDFDEGFLFFYFGNVDQVSHMMWRSMDPEHPAYDPAIDAPYAEVIPDKYIELDGVVGHTRERMRDDDLLVVMSDHGFTSWRRSFHLNAWLRKNGYLAVRNPNLKKDPGFLVNVDWSRTKAYGLGLNGLYLNLQGRERFGIVGQAERQKLIDEIAQKLLAEIDPVTEAPAITKMYDRDAFYRDRGHLLEGPDLLVGYAKGTRCSNQSAIGEVPTAVVVDNTERWSGDHCMDHEAVPGILVTSRPLKKQATSLRDLAASILAEFGITEFPTVSPAAAH